MTDPKVPTTSDTGEPKTKRADELERGDWVFDDRLETVLPQKILAVHPFVDQDTPMVMLAYTDEYERPYSKDFPAAAPIQLADEESVRDAHETARRWHLADQLRLLATLITDYELPLPKYALQISFGSVEPDVAAKVAEAVGSKVEQSYGTRSEVVWPPEHLTYQQGVHATWDTKMPELEPVDEDADPDHGRTTAVAEAKPDTLGVALGRASVPASDGGCE